MLDYQQKMASSALVDWRISAKPVAYDKALQEMEAHVEEIHRNGARERVWLLEHEPVYTAGTSALDSDLIAPDRFPVYRTGRGGQYTYHGPGQRIAYTMLDLNTRSRDIRGLITGLEAWIIATLARFGVVGETRKDRVGVWVRRADIAPGRDDKIAAIGIRVRRWVCFHGLSLNVEPNLEHFSGIVPCGVTGHGVTSLRDLGVDAEMADVDLVLRAEFEKIFGKTTTLQHPSGAVSGLTRTP